MFMSVLIYYLFVNFKVINQIKNYLYLKKGAAACQCPRFLIYFTSNCLERRKETLKKKKVSKLDGTT